MTIYNSGTFWNEALNLRTEKENLLKSRGEKKDRKSAECRITFHTVDYSASREDKGRPIVLKIQGRWGEIAFRVRVRCGMSTVGCWVNWIHVGNLNLQLKLKPALMFGASKGKSVFLVQIAARCSAARLARQHSQKVMWGTTTTFTKISLWQRRTADQVDTVFFIPPLFSCCHSPVYSHYISEGRPCGTASKSWQVAPLFSSSLG